MLTRRPEPRPWDVIALEVLLTVACAVQVGLLLWLAVATWEERGAPGMVIGVLVMVAMAVGAGWFLWLTGVNGWLLAGASGVAGIEVAFLMVLGATGQVLGVGAGPLLLSLGAAVLGVSCGIFLPAPSARRYAPTPRAREVAGGPPSAPPISPSVAAAADRYARPVVTGAVALTVAGARRMRRTGGPSAGPVEPSVDAAPDPVLQPRPGTPIRTMAPAAGTVDGPPTAVAGSASKGSTATVPAPAAGTPAAGASIAASPATPAAGTPAAGTPAAGSATRSGTGRTPGATPDPGAIARQARASIDAELAKPRGAGRGDAPAGTAPGFRHVDPPPPATRVPAPSGVEPRFSPSGGSTPPRPPTGSPTARAGDAPQPSDPSSVTPSLRQVPPADGGDGTGVGR